MADTTHSDIMVVGSSNTDMIVKLKRIPRPGETLLGGEFITAAGGKGANQAVAAARAGGRVGLIAKLGRDALGDQALAGFIRAGINVAGVTRDARLASGAALIFVARDGENSIGVASGANSRLFPTDIATAAPLISRAKILLVQLEVPLETILFAARQAKSKGMLVILNPAPAKTLPRRLLRCVSILTPNESEAERLTGIKVKGLIGARRAARELISRGARMIVITLGARGALVADKSQIRLVPGFKVRAVDTTGAGDVFNGALAVALTEGQSIEQAVHFANAAAAISVTSWGAQSSAPTRRKIQMFLKKR